MKIPSLSRVKLYLVNRFAPSAAFRSGAYIRHNQRRLEHLASLNLDLESKTVLEVGAGPGDHTHFFLDRRCAVTSSDARASNVAELRRRYPQIDVFQIDLNQPGELLKSRQFQLVYCYGLLYHLSDPAGAIAFMAARCTELLLLETCVSFGEHDAINIVPEPKRNPTQAASGVSCRPTRPWVYHELCKHFAHVYMPRTQPYHEEFPLDWMASAPPAHQLARAVFIASRKPLDNPLLVNGIPDKQTTR